MNDNEQHLSLTDQLVETLQSELLGGKYIGDEHFPTEQESVRRFGVSRVTVRRAYEILAKRGIVTRCPRRGTRVNTACRATTKPIGQIGAVLPLTSSFTCEFLNDLNQAAVSEESLIVLSQPFTNGAEQASAALNLAAKGIRNLVIWGMDQSLDLSVFTRLRYLGCNLVFFDHIQLPEAADFVSLDNRHAIRLLMKQALLDGCTFFVFAGIDRLSVFSNMEREVEYTNFCKRHRLNALKLEYNFSAFMQNQWDEHFGANLLQLPESEHIAVIAVNSRISTLCRQHSPRPFRYYSICTAHRSETPDCRLVRQPMGEMARLCFESLRRQKEQGASWQASERLVKGIPLWKIN